jgi:regulator of replication initiation timing
MATDRKLARLAKRVLRLKKRLEHHINENEELVIKLDNLKYYLNNPEPKRSI